MKEYTSYKMRLKPTIVTEAFKCFREKGIRAVKMDDIAHNLGISKRTLYELYSNKEDVLMEVIKLLYEDRLKRITQFKEVTDNVMDLLIEIFRLQLETAAATNNEFYKDLQRYSRAQRLLESYYENERKSTSGFFDEGIREGYFLDYIDYVIFQTITTNTFRMIRTNDEFSNMSYRDLFVNFIYPNVRGICTTRGIEKIDSFVKQLV